MDGECTAGSQREGGGGELHNPGRHFIFPFSSFLVAAARPRHLLTFPYPLLAHLGASGGAVISECFYSNSCSCSCSLDKIIS